MIARSGIFNGLLFTVARTDCGTGWQVLNPYGRPVETYRRREPAAASAAALNAAAS